MTVSPFRAEQGTSLETPSRARASFCQEVGTTWFFSSCGGILELRRGSQPSPCVGPGKPHLPIGLRGKPGGCARVTAGPKRPHLGVCPGPNIPLQGRQGSRGSIPGSPGESGLVSRGSQGLRSPLESRRGSLGAPERPQGSPASSSFWREDTGLLSRPCTKRRLSAREVGGVSGFSSSCSANGGFSRGTTRISGSLSCGAREVRSPCAWRGGALHCSRVTGGD